MKKIALLTMFAGIGCSAATESGLAVKAHRVDETCCLETDVVVGWTMNGACDDIAYFAQSPDGECYWFSCDNAPNDFDRVVNCAQECEDTGIWTLPECD